MGNKTNKKITAITIALTLSLSLGAVVFASDSFKTLNAWFGHIEIFRNDEQVELGAKPFIVDGTTYVPLRSMAEIFDVEVGWDGVLYRVDLDDELGKNLLYMADEIKEKSVEIATLEGQIEKLKLDIKAQEEANRREEARKNRERDKRREDNKDRNGLENLSYELKKDYNRYKGDNTDVFFNIDLIGDKDLIEVDITTTSRYYLDDLAIDEIQSYLENLSRKIRSEFKEATIQGRIADDYTQYFFFYSTDGDLYLVD